ncbi:MAG: RNA polymerase sigma factor [Cryomorphaceae bacterium]
MNGDRASQRKLVEHYSPMLFTVARRYACQDQDARDILQDALIRILKGLQKNYKERGKPEEWMRTVVITTAINALNKAKVKYEVAVEQMPYDVGCPPDAYADMGAEVLMELIEQLPDGYKQVFSLFVIESHSHREISEMLGISEGSSRSQLVRARMALQAMILKNEKVRI